MYRFAHLLQEELKHTQIREISRSTGLAIASIHDYAYMPKEPRLSQLQKLATYFGESIGQLIGEDDALTAHLITTVRNLSEPDKRHLRHYLQETMPKNPSSKNFKQ
jgi:transcriptional regulator with XRE-family HTH domain